MTGTGDWRPKFGPVRIPNMLNIGKPGVVILPL